VATISRLLKITGLFCRISSLLQGSFAKETYNFKEHTSRSHPIPPMYILLYISPCEMAAVISLFVCAYVLCVCVCGLAETKCVCVCNLDINYITHTYTHTRIQWKFAPHVAHVNHINSYVHIAHIRLSKNSQSSHMLM